MENKGGKMWKFEIPTLLTDLNSYINAERTNKYIASKIKRDDTRLVAMCCNKLPKLPKNIIIKITHYCKNKKKDRDNIAFMKKFILDGLIIAGKMENDGWKDYIRWKEEFKIDKKERIEIEIREEEK